MATTPPPQPISREPLPWWGYDATVESLDDVAHIRARLRSRLTGQPGVRIVDLLLIIDVLLTDAFDRGFAQQDLRIAVRISDSRLLLVLNATDTPATIGSTLPRSASKALLDVTSTDWGERHQHGRKITWVEIDTNRTSRAGDEPTAETSTCVRDHIHSGGRRHGGRRTMGLGHAGTPSSL